MPKTINVTAKDIRRGVKQDPWRCPIARACRRTRLTNAEVGGLCDFETAAIFYGNLGEAQKSTYKLPKEAWKFARAFDRGAKVKPFRFTIK